ncbi:MAG: hypothetical protein LBV62_01965 [Rickettsiales bacterium]|nr:hypothetical protein [Rickettsiales bacterium]
MIKSQIIERIPWPIGTTGGHQPQRVNEGAAHENHIMGILELMTRMSLMLMR